MKMIRSLGVAAFLAAVSFFVGCSSSGPGESGPGTDTASSDNDTGSGTDTGSTPDTKPPGCVTPADCDDGFSCTIDSCASGACSHTIGPNAGPTACAAGEFCVLSKGCVKGKACATSKDCVDTDACTANETCDPASSVCTYIILDKDGDGHPPPVCGGDDCDDNDKTVYPGAPELCGDRKDNDCDGVVDPDGSICPDSIHTCKTNACVCKSDHLCGTSPVCHDFMTDKTACGGCGNFCPDIIGGGCAAGVCTCADADKCGGKCVSLRFDSLNCGTCGVKCPPSQFCYNGVCDCPADTMGGCGTGPSTHICTDPRSCGFSCSDCGGGSCVKGVCVCSVVGAVTCGTTPCVDTNSDSNNCGGCGTVCPKGRACSSGKCTCTSKPLSATCGGMTVDLYCDNANCGACGVVCGAGTWCTLGKCT